MQASSSHQFRSPSSSSPYKQNVLLNLVLYVGLGIVTLGMIFVALGEGEKGFKSQHLKMVGPAMIVVGLLLALIWIFILMLPFCLDKSELGRRMMTWGRRADKTGRQQKKKNPEQRMQKPNKRIERNANPTKDTKKIPEINISFDADNLQSEKQDTAGYINSSFNDDIYTVEHTSRVEVESRYRV